MQLKDDGAVKTALLAIPQSPSWSCCYACLMKPLFKWGAAGVAVLVVAGAALWASQRGSKVQVSPVVRTGIVQSVVATGRLNAPARMDIGSEVTATVLEVKVREGEIYSLQMGDCLLIMGDTSKLRVRMDVDERDVARVRLGAAAYARADASTLAPFMYAQLLVATFWGWFVFDNLPDGFTLLGMLFILGSGLYVLNDGRRQGKLEKTDEAAAAPE